MQRSRLRNIIDKSKGISNKSVGDPFDDFVKSLPKELDYYKNNDNYRLKAAWVAYGTPKNYKEAVWEGLIQPIDENTYKMPSIGYNNETEDYEYLNKGKDGEIVEKDIRAWDNDVIPFIKELKLGGYVRTFNEEENFWTYSKNSQKKEESIESGELQTVIEAFKEGGQMNVIPEGALHARKNNMEGAGEDFTAKGIPVMTMDGKELVAEIEKNEIIFNKEVTDFVEENYKKFNSDISIIEKDELAIKVGKRLAKEILDNTDDRTGLIEEVANKNNLEYNK